MPAEDLPLATLSGRPYAVPLGPGPDPDRVIPWLSRRDHPGVLWGDWFGGGAVLLHSPLRTLAPGTAADGWRLLDDQPALKEAASRTAFDGLGGGWLVCLGYSPRTSWLGFFDHLLRWHPDGSWTFESLGLDGRSEAMKRALEQARALLVQAAEPPARSAPGWTVGPFRAFDPPRRARQHYLAAVDGAIGLIHRGDFYQVNLCTRLAATFDGDPLALFADLGARLQPSWGALVSNGSRTVASFSPELFLRVQGRTVTTSPIKGTAPRTEGELDSPELRVSAKDAAENVMIVDLMRNDLSRVSLPGTVAVTDLLALQAHPGVWHLVSTVTGRLRAAVTTSELLEATFPPGSVTGAPKLSAVEAITVLEPYRRGAYTGAVGFVSPTAGTELNVLIRTFEIGESKVELGVGGGITVDSAPVREWYECLDKAAPLVRAASSTLDPDLRAGPRARAFRQAEGGVFETVLAQGGAPLRLAGHLARMDRSCRELYGEGIPSDLAARILHELRTLKPGPVARHAVRVHGSPAHLNLTFTVKVRVAQPRLTRCALVEGVRTQTSWRHKWAIRDELTAAESAAGASLPYFTDEAGEVSETSRGNLFCRAPDRVWLTPPLDESVLPGVTRRALLDLLPRMGIPVRVEPFTPAALRTATGAFWTSSLSGAVLVTEVDGQPLLSCEPILARINLGLGLTDGARSR